MILERPQVAKALMGLVEQQLQAKLTTKPQVDAVLGFCELVGHRLGTNVPLFSSLLRLCEDTTTFTTSQNPASV